jgi:stress response protein YsnF
MKKIDWCTGKIHAELSRRDIKKSPEYDDTLTIDHEYEERIHRHYDEHCETRPPYVGAP